MPRTISSRDLRKTDEISELCHRDPEPIYVTKNGVDDMVIMSVDTYHNLVEKIQMLQLLLLSEQQRKKGQMQNAREVLKELKDKHGL